MVICKPPEINENLNLKDRMSDLIRFFQETDIETLEIDTETKKYLREIKNSLSK